MKFKITWCDENHCEQFYVDGTIDFNFGHSLIVKEDILIHNGVQYPASLIDDIWSEYEEKYGVGRLDQYGDDDWYQLDLTDQYSESDARKIAINLLPQLESIFK